MITVVNQSSDVSDEQVRLMVRACAHQLRYDASPKWRLMPMPVVFGEPGQTAPPGSWVIGVLNDADQADALGWHTEEGGVVFGRVFTSPVLDNGGDVLDGPVSVASVLSHEVLETWADPACNAERSCGDGTSVALEIADPVESDTYDVRVSGQVVSVSNFVTEAWCDPQNRTGPWDFLGLLDGPLQMRPGGYMVVTRQGRTREVYGSEHPQWRRAMKRTPLARSARRQR